MRLPDVCFDHLDHLTDAGGLHEHALGAQPRPEHAYCVDDVARALVVTARETRPDRRVDRLRRQYLAFVVAAVAPDGRVHNRRGKDLLWSDLPTLEDCWGRALQGLGAVVGSTSGGVPVAERDEALAAFVRAASWRSPHRRATAFAALGAAEVLRARPGTAAAERLLLDAAVVLAERPRTPEAGWPWPEPRLTYANATVAEALLAAGDVLGRPDLLTRGLDLLAWLAEVQTVDGHLSVVPVGGRGPGDASSRFDQQPIEVGVLAEACARAHDVTGEARWARVVDLAAAWFLGDNDSGAVMLDPATGAGFDGLTPRGRNENQGAESTLAAMSTLQQAARLRSAVRAPVRPGTPPVVGEVPAA